MHFSRQSCLSALFSYLIAFGLFFILNGGAIGLLAQAAAAPVAGQATPPPQKKQNPFESVPQAEIPKPEPPSAQPAKPGVPPPATPAATAA